MLYTAQSNKIEQKFTYFFPIPKSVLQGMLKDNLND